MYFTASVAFRQIRRVTVCAKLIKNSICGGRYIYSKLSWCLKGKVYFVFSRGNVLESQVADFSINDGSMYSL